MKIIYKIKQELGNLLLKIKCLLLETKEKVNYNVPYVCQFSIPENAEKSLKNELNTIEDSNWPNTGARSKEEYTKWAFTMCGMACTSMILDFYKKIKINPVVLAEDALNSDVYEMEYGTISNMKYKEYLAWITKYNLIGKIYTRLSIKGIQYSLSNRDLVIASVNPNIRGFNTVPIDQKGGHLVVVTGYNMRDHTITINNPSGFFNTNTQTAHTLPITNFMKYYAGRGIVVSNSLNI